MDDITEIRFPKDTDQGIGADLGADVPSHKGSSGFNRLVAYDAAEMHDLALSPPSQEPTLSPSNKSLLSPYNQLQKGISSGVAGERVPQYEFGAEGAADRQESGLETDSPGERYLPSLNVPGATRDTAMAGWFLVQALVFAIFFIFQSATGGSPDRTASVKQMLLLFNFILTLCVLYSAAWRQLFFSIAKYKFAFISHILSSSWLLVFSLFLIVLAFDGSTSFLLCLLMGSIIFYMATREVLWSLRFRRSMGEGGAQYVASLLEIAEQALRAHPGTTYTWIILLLFQTFWLRWWAHSLLIPVINGDMGPLRFLVLMVHYYWTSQFIKALLAHVVAGCVYVWFYEKMESNITRPAPDVQEEELDSTAGNGTCQEDDLEYGEVQSGRDKNPTATRHQFRHASAHFCRTGVTTSLGSVALVALVSPPTHALWWTRRSGRRIRHRGTWKARILERFCPQLISDDSDDALGRFIKCHHAFGLPHIAGYNKAARTAARDVWDSIERAGTEAVIDDDNSARIVRVAALGTAALFAVLFGASVEGEQAATLQLVIISYLACYASISLCTRLISAAVQSIFICFSEHPQGLAEINPIMYHRLVRLTEWRRFKVSQQG